MRTIIIVGLGGGLMTLACGPVVVRESNPNHCEPQTGDDWCAEVHGGERPYCVKGTCGRTSRPDGCEESRPSDDECYSPCGGRATIVEDASCIEIGSTGSSGTSTGETTEGPGSSSESSTTGPVPCMGNEDCQDAAAPFCEPVSGECVPCDALGAEADTACAELEPMAPLCVNGTCVACTPENPAVCDDQLLLCDGDTNTCTQCTEHDQCGSGACELAVGRCFPGDFVVHVDGDGGQDYSTVVAAVAAVDDGTHGVIVVHELDGGSSYQAPGGLVIDGSKTIALLAAAGEAPTIQGTGGNPGLQVVGAGTQLYMDGLSVSGNTGGLGVVVDGAFAWADRSHILQNSSGGVLAQNSASLTARNCFVGGAVSDVDAIELDGSTLVASYTTIGGGPVLGGRARALSCTGAAIAYIRNSILVSADPMPEVECPGASLSNSATESDVGMLNIAWFTGYATGNFHLSPSGQMVFADLALWSTGDPLTDIDGDPRVAVDGSPDYAGADVP